MFLAFVSIFQSFFNTPLCPDDLARDMLLAQRTRIDSLETQLREAQGGLLWFTATLTLTLPLTLPLDQDSAPPLHTIAPLTKPFARTLTFDKTCGAPPSPQKSTYYELFPRQRSSWNKMFVFERWGFQHIYSHVSPTYTFPQPLCSSELGKTSRRSETNLCFFCGRTFVLQGGFPSISEIVCGCECDWVRINGLYGPHSDEWFGSLEATGGLQYRVLPHSVERGFGR